MAVDERIRSLREFYENRYEKAKKMGINSESKYYTKFLEVEKRYTAVKLCEEYMGIIFDIGTSRNIKRSLFYAMEKILEILTIAEYIINENGKKEYIKKNISINKEESEAISAYNNAIKGLECLQNMDINKGKEILSKEIQEAVFYIINWMIVVRERKNPINKKV